MSLEEKYTFAKHTAEPRESNEHTTQTPRTFSPLEDGNQKTLTDPKGDYYGGSGLYGVQGAHAPLPYGSKTYCDMLPLYAR